MYNTQITVQRMSACKTDVKLYMMMMMTHEKLMQSAHRLLKVLQILKFYTIVKIILKLAFWTVVLCWSECMRDKLRGVYTVMQSKIMQ